MYRRYSKKRLSSRRSKRRITTFRRRSKYARRRTNLVSSSPLTGIASNVKTVLKYHTRFPLSLTSGVINDYKFNLNSLFDPDLTATGHQPLYFDQLSSIYSRYRVWKVSWVIKPISDSSSSCETTVVPTNSSTSFSNSDTAAEYPRAVYKQWNGSLPTTFRGWSYLPSLTGVTPSAYRSDDRFQAGVSESPIEVMPLHIVNISSSSINIIVDVQLKFHCEFYDPYAIGGS